MILSPVLFVLPLALTAQTIVTESSQVTSSDLQGDSAILSQDDFLSVEPDFWDLNGTKVFRHSEEVPLGLFFLNLAETIKGSKTAEEHAAKARVWSIISAPFTILSYSAALSAIGWLAYSAVALPNEGLDTTVVPALGLMAGSLTLLIPTIIAQDFYSGELQMAVNSYNKDVLKSSVKSSCTESTSKPNAAQ